MTTAIIIHFMTFHKNFCDFFILFYIEYLWNELKKYKTHWLEFTQSNSIKLVKTLMIYCS